MKPNNKEIQKLRLSLKHINSEMFNVLGGKESLIIRSKISEIDTKLRQMQVDNKNKGDDSVPFITWNV